jgi:phthiocerol/phenolphthiocerol synthesis type-I polyketide synthase E
MDTFSDNPAEVVSRIRSERKSRPEVGEYTAPTDELEVAVSEIWSEVLRIEPIGPQDNIFDFGGDSLHMAQIAARIWTRFRVRISIDTFFENLTVASIAAVVRNSGQIES